MSGPLTDEQLAEIKARVANVIEIFGENWTSETDDDEELLMVKTADSAPYLSGQAYVTIATTYQENPHLREFLTTSLDTQVALLAEIARQASALRGAGQHIGEVLAANERLTMELAKLRAEVAEEHP